MSKKEIITEIEGRRLKLSNLQKILYPNVGIVKAEIINYYITAAPYILDHISHRPLTLIRYPDGITKNRFYSKNKPNWTPQWIASTKTSKEDEITYIMANETATLAWTANLASLELHTMQVKANHLDYADHFIIDLDPPESSEFDIVKQVALNLKPFLESYGYHPFLKTSGSKGLHIYVPILPQYDNETLITSVKSIAKEYIKSDPSVTLQMNKKSRQGKVLIDIYRNHKSQTCIAPYSTRAKEGAPVSTPINWDELPEIESSSKFKIHAVLTRLETVGDPWKNMYEYAMPLHDQKEKKSNKNVTISTNQTSNNKSNLKKHTIETFEGKTPMLAFPGDKIPNKTKYTYEIKWDGIRVFIKKKGKTVTITSRKGNDLTEKFPLIVSALKKQKPEEIITDGEIVALNKDGTPNFSKVVGRMHLTGRNPIAKAARQNQTVFYAFDCIYIDGTSLIDQPIEVRRNKLQENINVDVHIRYSQSFDDGNQLFEAVKMKGMEGIMCKKKGSKYELGQRSKSWLKIKVQFTDDPLIIGYTKGKGGRSNLFGSLHLAKIEDQNLVYYGKVGTGFNQIKMKEIFTLLENVSTTKKPISNTIDEEKDTIWIEPEYSCELKYASFTSNNTYREPVFIKMKVNKKTK